MNLGQMTWMKHFLYGRKGEIRVCEHRLFHIQHKLLFKYYLLIKRINVLCLAVIDIHNKLTLRIYLIVIHNLPRNLSIFKSVTTGNMRPSSCLTRKVCMHVSVWGLISVSVREVTMLYSVGPFIESLLGISNCVDYINIQDRAD